MAERDVLAAADAAADAALASHDFADERVERAGVRQEMSVVPVVRQHHVVGIVERADDAHLAEFLTKTRVRSAGKKSAAEQIEKKLLGQTDEVREPVDRLGVQWKNRFSVRVSLEK